MKTTLTALLAICLWLPLIGDDAAKKKFEEAKALAEEGDAHAQYSLGLMYARGEGVAQSKAMAFQWLKSAAAEGEPDLMVKTIFAKAEFGDLNSQKLLGEIFAGFRPRGLLIKRSCGKRPVRRYLGSSHVDFNEAKKWLIKAAHQGDAKSQYILGLIFSGYTKTPSDIFAEINGFNDVHGSARTIRSKTPFKKNYSEAYKWHHIASLNYEIMIKELMKKMSSVNRNEAIKELELRARDKFRLEPRFSVFPLKKPIVNLDHLPNFLKELIEDSIYNQWNLKGFENGVIVPRGFGKPRLTSVQLAKAKALANEMLKKHPKLLKE